MEILINNCNSIDEAKIKIEPNHLNIKYGMNGTGKSTIVRALELALSKEKDLSKLTPFKYLETSEKKPSIQGLENINSAFTFNEDYVNQFIFKQDEIINNSFEIFIKTSEYDKTMEEIELSVAKIKETFKSNKQLEEIILDLTELKNSFGKEVKSGVHSSSPLKKALGNGNLLENIPASLSSYEPFLRGSENVQWVKWQKDGNAFIEISDNCPYCTSPALAKKEMILSVSKEFDHKVVEHLNKIIGVLEKLGKYFHPDTKMELEKICRNITGLKAEEESYLLKVKSDIETLRNKLTSVKEISFFSLKNDEKLSIKIESLKINIDLLSYMKSDDTLAIVDSINKSLDEVLKNIERLQEQINSQKTSIHNTIKKHKEEINNFLKYAGYSYTVDIQEDGEQYKMRLKHTDSDKNLLNAAYHLSYGERNAFALVLFMYECLSKEIGLIILDDPISSFDRHKKFAITEMLFLRDGSLKDKTVLMMTHDFEPIIYMLVTLYKDFKDRLLAHFIKNNSGVLEEKRIKRDDIITFSKLCSKNIRDNQSIIIKLIYLRRYFEIMDDKGTPYSVLSSLFHKRVNPTFDKEGLNPVSLEDCEKAFNQIREWITEFDYNACLTMINDKNSMMTLYSSTNINYEKLQIFRMLNEQELHENNVIRKFINETLHIENEYLMQLDPAKYDLIPEYLIAECSQSLNETP